MANLENLTSWKQGESGNPAGKPKGTLNRSTILRRYMSAKLKDNPSDVPFELEGKITVEEAIVLALIKKALAGDVSAIREIQDTAYGKLTESSEMSHTYTQMGEVLVNKEPMTFKIGDSPTGKPAH